MALKIGLRIGVIIASVATIAVLSMSLIVGFPLSSSFFAPSTTSTAPVPSSLTWETSQTVQFLDPQISYYSFDYNILQNVYQPLLWYKGTSADKVTPLLASTYTISADGKTSTFTLRSGINFQDGNLLNSTAVYFSLTRLLVEDGSSPYNHGSQASWILQQLLNESYSTTLCNQAPQGCYPNFYSSTWLSLVLGQNFVQTTGPLTFQFNIMNPQPASFPLLLANVYASIIDPLYVMPLDVNLWQSQGYSLPFPTLSGSETNMINQYFQDEIATCNTGPTPNGCGQTFLDAPKLGSLAGTGPYVLSSFNPSTNDIVLSASNNYWKKSPAIPTIIINYVPSLFQRENDIQTSVKSGMAMTIDVPSFSLYDFINRNDWLTQGKVVPTISNVSVYGPFTEFGTFFDPFATNVTDLYTGQYLSFQPFADLRMRLAFADAVNVSDVAFNYNDNFGPIPNTVVPPNLPPKGSYNSSIPTAYSYNLSNVYNLLISAMENPVTSFTFTNGSPAPAGTFNNAFGCSASVYSSNNNYCPNPIEQTISLVYSQGEVYDQQIFATIAANINTISQQHNLGLTVTIEPANNIFQYVFSGPHGHAYMYALGWLDDYPWVNDFLLPMLSPIGFYPQVDGMNYSALATLSQQATSDNAVGNTAGLVTVSNQINAFGNNEVMYLYTSYIPAFTVMTSNVQGFYYNPSINGMYFAALS